MRNLHFLGGGGDALPTLVKPTSSEVKCQIKSLRNIVLNQCTTTVYAGTSLITKNNDRLWQQMDDNR